MSNGVSSHLLPSSFDGYFHSYGCSSSYTFYSFSFEYLKISYAQWQKAQVFISFRSRVIEKTITHTDSLKKALTVVNPTIVRETPPSGKNFGSKTILWPSSGRKGIVCKISLHLLVPCPNAWRTNRQTNKQTNFLLYIYR